MKHSLIILWLIDVLIDWLSHCWIDWSGEEMLELMRKDMIELKRNLNDEVREKELFSKINEELRGTIKKNEGEKTELNRDLCDHRQRCSSKYTTTPGIEDLV